MVYEPRAHRMNVVSEKTIPLRYKNLFTYLRHTNKPLGLLMNFNVAVLVDGVDRIKNGH